MSSNARKLAEHLVEFMEGLEVTYFCGNRRLDELPSILTENNIAVHEIEAYSTKLVPSELSNEVKGLLFSVPQLLKVTY